MFRSDLYRDRVVIKIATSCIGPYACCTTVQQGTIGRHCCVAANTLFIFKLAEVPGFPSLSLAREGIKILISEESARTSHRDAACEEQRCVHVSWHLASDHRGIVTIVLLFREV